MQSNINPEDFISVIGSGNLAKVEKILKENPTLIRARGLKGMSPLHVAASQCRRSMARLLIKCGAEVNSKKDDGWTPLHFACQNGDVNTVKLLLDSGADPNMKSNDDLTPLHSAAYGVSESTMSILKSAVNMTEDGALLIDYAGVARELIQRGAELNPRNKSKGATPLVWLFSVVRNLSRRFFWRTRLRSTLLPWTEGLRCTLLLPGVVRPWFGCWSKRAPIWKPEIRWGESPWIWWDWQTIGQHRTYDEYA